MSPEDRLDQVPQASIGELGRGGCGSVVEAAASLPKRLTDFSNTAASLLREELDHRPSPAWGLVPRMTAAFFKMSFSSLRLVFSRRKRRSSSAAGTSPSARSPSLPSCAACEPFLTHR